MCYDFICSIYLCQRPGHYGHCSQCLCSRMRMDIVSFVEVVLIVADEIGLCTIIHGGLLHALVPKRFLMRRLDTRI